METIAIEPAIATDVPARGTLCLQVLASSTPSIELLSTLSKVWHDQLGSPADLPFEHGIVAEGSTPWQPMSMILIARPRNGLGMDLYEGRTAPGIRGAREPARSHRGPAPVAGSQTSIT